MNKIISLEIIINYRYSTHYKIIHYNPNFIVTRALLNTLDYKLKVIEA